MKVMFALLLMFTNWYYIPKDSPAVPVEVESIDLKLKSDELAITFFSLSDGEASLIQRENGENILINLGGKETKAELEKLLHLYGADKISTIIFTKKEFYNKENLDWLIKDYDVKQVITGASIAGELKNELGKIENTTLHIWSKNTKQQILPEVGTEVIFEGNEEGEGIDVTFTFSNHKIFFMSSVSKRATEIFMKKNLSDVNIVKLPEFGREDSITESLIKHLDPQISVIFHAKRVKQSSELFKILNDAWIDVYYTKKHGTATVKFTDNNYEIFTIHEGD